MLGERHRSPGGVYLPGPSAWRVEAASAAGAALIQSTPPEFDRLYGSSRLTQAGCAFAVASVGLSAEEMLDAASSRFVLLCFGRQRRLRWPRVDRLPLAPESRMST